MSLVFGISFLPASDSLASLLYFAFVLTDSVPWATPIFNVGHVVDSAQLTIKQITASAVVVEQLIQFLQLVIAQSYRVSSDRLNLSP